MKRTAVCFAFSLIVASIICAKEPDESKLVDLPGIGSFVQITDQPHAMYGPSSSACAAPLIHKPDDPHTQLDDVLYCHVYVSQGARESILSGKDNYPVHSKIIKSKLPKKKSTEAILYTVMTKMEDGYDSENGNWRYSVLDGKTARELAAGRIESCIECHKDYKETGYITRTYLNKPEIKKSQE